MSGVSVAKKNGGQTSAIFANDTRWRPNSQILYRRDGSNSRVTETARPSGNKEFVFVFCSPQVAWFQAALPHNQYVLRLFQWGILKSSFLLSSFLPMKDKLIVPMGYKIANIITFSLVLQS